MADLPIVEVDEWPQYRHKKRGTTYTVMGRATMQVDGPLDNVKVVIYQSNVDGSMWVRPVTEFEDGRFERIVQQQSAPLTIDDVPSCGSENDYGAAKRAST